MDFPKELEVESRSSIFYFDGPTMKLEKPPDEEQKDGVMRAIHDLSEHRGDLSSERKSSQDKENGQDHRLSWAGRLLAAALLVLVGLFFFVHGCGQHDHDDELLLPSESRPSAGP
jgi:hypothetical protein